MKFHECDEIGSDVFEAEAKFGCRLDVQIVLEVMAHVASWYKPGEELDFESILDDGLDMHEPMDEDERHAYKFALGTIYNRRARTSTRSKKFSR